MVLSGEMHFSIKIVKNVYIHELKVSKDIINIIHYLYNDVLAV